MDREQKIALLQKIAAGEASPEVLRPRHTVHRIFGAGKGQNGLYVNGKLSTDPANQEYFRKEFAAGRVKVVRKLPEDTDE